MGLRILYKLTTRTRPERAYEVIRSIIDLQDNKEDFSILISIDEDDVTKQILIDKCLADEKITSHPFDTIVLMTGESKGKIGSINRDIDKWPYEWDILVNVSDDTVFIKQGFDSLIRQKFEDFKGVLHTPDGNRADLMTMSIMHREYYDLDGYIYFPKYDNLWCDDEAQEVAKIRKLYKFCPVQIIEHRHWAYNKGPSDNQYYEQNQTFGKDKELFDKRKEINFGL